MNANPDPKFFLIKIHLSSAHNKRERNEKMTKKFTMTMMQIHTGTGTHVPNSDVLDPDPHSECGSKRSEKS
jgi:hypothetical protein